MSTLQTLYVHPIFGADVQADTAQLETQIQRANAAFGARYGVRFQLAQPPAAARASVVHLIFLWKTCPAQLQDLPLTGPQRIVLQRKAPSLFETAEEVQAFAEVLTFSKAQGSRSLSYEDAAQLTEQVHAGLARLAYEHSLRRQPMLQRACSTCGARPHPPSSQTCTEHQQILHLPGLGEAQRAPAEGNTLYLRKDHYYVHGQIGESLLRPLYCGSRQRDGQLVSVQRLRVDNAPLGVGKLDQKLRQRAALEHPQLATLLDFGDPSGPQPYLALQLQPGRPLLSGQPPISPQQWLDLAIDLLAGLEALHGAQLHCVELSPRDVWLRDDPQQPDAPPQPVLHVAAVHSLSPQLSLEDWQRAVRSGDYPYIAPEHLVGEAAPDHRADLYALTVILYQGLTGKLPFPEMRFDAQVGPEAGRAQWVQSLQRSPETIELLSLPPELVTALRKALSQSPADRFDSAHALRAALVNARGHWRRQSEAAQQPKPLPEPIAALRSQLSSAKKPEPAAEPAALEISLPPVTRPAAKAAAQQREQDQQTSLLPQVASRRLWRGHATVAAVVAAGLLLGSALVWSVQGPSRADEPAPQALNVEHGEAPPPSAEAPLIAPEADGDEPTVKVAEGAEEAARVPAFMAGAFGLAAADSAPAGGGAAAAEPLDAPDPEVAQAAFEVVEETPEVVEETPEVAQAAFEVAEETPEVVEETPEVAQAAFEVAEESPEVVEETPEVAHGAFELAAEVPAQAALWMALYARTQAVFHLDDPPAWALAAEAGLLTAGADDALFDEADEPIEEATTQIVPAAPQWTDDMIQAPPVPARLALAELEAEAPVLAETVRLEPALVEASVRPRAEAPAKKVAQAKKKRSSKKVARKSSKKGKKSARTAKRRPQPKVRNQAKAVRVKHRRANQVVAQATPVVPLSRDDEPETPRAKARQVPVPLSTTAQADPRTQPLPPPPSAAYSKALQEGQAHIAAKQLPEGIASLEKAARLRPQAKDPHQILCRVQRMAGQPQQARRHCEIWKRLERSDQARAAAQAQIDLLAL